MKQSLYFNGCVCLQKANNCHLVVDNLFPINLKAAEKDHDFLDQDALHAVFRYDIRHVSIDDEQLGIQLCVSMFLSRHSNIAHSISASQKSHVFLAFKILICHHIQ